MRLLSNGPRETFRFGFRLGCLLKKGDTVCLFGEMGAGKTTFVKGIASALGISERDITSASFTIIAEYGANRQGAAIPFYHIDLYRIGEASALDSIGIYECIGGDGIAVIEWAERLAVIEDSITVRFRVTGTESREIVIEGLDEKNRTDM